MLKRVVFLLLSVVSTAPLLAHQANAPAASGVTLERIMADTDWIGNPPEEAYWGYDSRTVYYWQKREGSELRDLYAVDVESGDVHKLADSELAGASAPGGAYNQARTLYVFVRDNNLFVRDLRSGSLRQLTRRPGQKNNPMFMADGAHVQWHEGYDIFVEDLASGLISLAADLRFSTDPGQAPSPTSYVQAEQLRLFDTLRNRQANQQAEREQEAARTAADTTRVPAPWYLGDTISIAASSLSPDGRWLLLVTQPRAHESGAPGMMPNYITKSGYAEILKRHTYVGHNPPPAQQVKVLDLRSHTSFDLDLTTLPGIKDDPLASLRQQAVAWDVEHGMTRDAAEASVKAPPVRAVSVAGFTWTDDGSHLAVQFRANDNKDRWIASVNFAGKSLVTENRLTDPAWINWDYNDFGWLHDNHTLWYLSEAANYSHLYVEDVNGGEPRQLTSGAFEVSNPILTHDDGAFFVVANKPAPGTYEIYRVDTSGGAMEPVTHLGGLNGPQPAMEGGESYALSPDGSKLLVYHSESVRPPEIYAVDARPDGTAKEITHTASSAFTSVDWIVPRIVEVPSSHVTQPIYARFYAPKDARPDRSRPAVVFIHGAGYLQDAHSGWSYYFHELMFHTFLVQHGYLVLDMDYRGSAGYGRDWRTAIYRHMGHPEVEDIVDGVHWLEQTWRADPKRLGVYGGSYGGFMTYMMMFREPDLFAAGAALRPVGDWADYADDYTSDILNRPNIDPQAYDDSSPIHYASALKGHLLILQGMEDDNVFFIDTVHMTQKLIELKNPNFDVMFYPTQRHGFTDATAWLDEYRRIWRLFQTYVDPQASAGRSTPREASQPGPRSRRAAQE